MDVSFLTIAGSIEPVKRKKRVAKKRAVDEKVPDFTTNEYTPKFPLNKNPKFIEIYAYLSHEDGKAEFLDKEDPTSDYFYKGLVDLKKRHKQFLGHYEEKYRLPYDVLGFRWKQYGKSGIKCYDSDGIPTSITALKGKKVRFFLQVLPYDFISKKTKARLIGLSIRVQAVSAVGKYSGNLR